MRVSGSANGLPVCWKRLKGFDPALHDSAGSEDGGEASSRGDLNPDPTHISLAARRIFRERPVKGKPLSWRRGTNLPFVPPGAGLRKIRTL